MCSERNGPISCYRVVIIKLPAGFERALTTLSSADLNITSYGLVHAKRVASANIASVSSASLSSSSAFALSPPENDDGDGHEGLANQAVGAYVAEEFSSESNAIGSDVIIGDEAHSKCDSREELAGRVHSLAPRRTSYAPVDAAAGPYMDMSAYGRVFDGQLDPRTNYRCVNIARPALLRAGRCLHSHLSLLAVNIQRFRASRAKVINAQLLYRSTKSFSKLRSLDVCLLNAAYVFTHFSLALPIHSNLYSGYVEVSVFGQNGTLLTLQSSLFVPAVLTGGVTPAATNALSPHFSTFNDSVTAIIFGTGAGLVLILLLLLFVLCFLKKKATEENADNGVDVLEDERLGMAVLHTLASNGKSGVANGGTVTITAHERIGQPILMQDLPGVFVERPPDGDVPQTEFEMIVPEQYTTEECPLNDGTLPENEKNQSPDISDFWC